MSDAPVLNAAAERNHRRRLARADLPAAQTAMKFAPYQFSHLEIISKAIQHK